MIRFANYKEKFVGKIVLFGLVLLVMQSCIPLKDLKLLQEDENLELNSDGFIITNAEEYRLQQDDILTMNIFTRDPTFVQKYGDQYTRGVGNANESAYYTRGLFIQKNGKVEIPRLGDIYVLGLTLNEAKEKIERKFVKEEYKEGEVLVKLQLSGIQFTFLGEVGRPGNFTVFRSRLNLIEALAQAGDFRTVADRKNVKLYRKYPEGIRVVNLDFTKESIMNSEFFYVQPNDQFIINPKVQRTIGFGTNFAGTVTTLAATLSGLLAIIFVFNRF